MSEQHPVVVDVPERSRYELLLDGRRIGLADYRVATVDGGPVVAVTAYDGEVGARRGGSRGLR